MTWLKIEMGYEKEPEMAKQANWRRRLVRVWAAVSLIYAVLVVSVVVSVSDLDSGIGPMGWAVRLIASVGLVLAFWWAALYTCFWMAAKSHNDKQ